MTKPRRIALFYSVGPHFEHALRALRGKHPGGEIVAIAPPDVVPTTSADTIMTTERASYSPRNVAACQRLVRRIRAARYDVFGVLFDSPQLRILAALSGAPTRIVVMPHGEIAPLNEGIAFVLVDLALRRVWGHIAYAAMWLIVHAWPVRKG